MRRSKTSSAKFGRSLVALVCAVSIAFNLAALGHARGVVATRYVQAAMVAAATEQPCPTTTHGRTICPFATFVPGSLAEGSVVRLPDEVRIEWFARANDIALSSYTSDAPFRPPREI
jgi:hypothetical protein